MPANDKGDFAAPGVDEAGPASVEGDVLAIFCTEADRGVIERLTSILQNCWQQRVECVRDRELSNIKGLMYQSNYYFFSLKIDIY